MALTETVSRTALLNPRPIASASPTGNLVRSKIATYSGYAKTYPSPPSIES